MKLQSVVTQSARPGVGSRARVSRLWACFLGEEEIAVDPRVLAVRRRAVWIGCALIVQTLNFIAIAFVGANPDWSAQGSVLFGALLPLLLTLASFLLIGMAFRPFKLFYVSQRCILLWQRIVLLLLVPTALAGCVLCWDTFSESVAAPTYTNDGTSLSVNAALLLLHGHNPYTDSNIVSVAQRFAIKPDWTTPLRAGQFAARLDYPSSADLRTAFKGERQTGDTQEFESRVSYPAFSFLVLVPFVFLPYHNVFPFYLVSYLALVFVGWRMAHSALRPWVLLLALANVPMWTSVMGGNLDVFYCLLLVLAWQQRDHRWRSPLLLGLALASKQIAWFFIPFYLILTWRIKGRQEALVRALIAGGVTSAINLPFLLWSPHAWLAGILAPVADPMFPLGIGIINLSVAHVIPFLPFLLYPLLEYGTLCCSFAWYWRLCRLHPESALLLAVIPLFFAWRSLPSYFCCTAYPLFLVLVARSSTPGPTQEQGTWMRASGGGNVPSGCTQYHCHPGGQA